MSHVRRGAVSLSLTRVTRDADGGCRTPLAGWDMGRRERRQTAAAAWQRAATPRLSDASYSTYPLYCTPDAKDIQTVFLVRVVVGEYCKGYKHAVTPDVRNAAKNQLYDSTVDNPRDPSIFVTYHDAQAYPEYCIKFTQLKSSVPNEHPAANKPAHRLYRRNLVLDVD